MRITEFLVHWRFEIRLKKCEGCCRKRATAGDASSTCICIETSKTWKGNQEFINALCRPVVFQDKAQPFISHQMAILCLVIPVCINGPIYLCIIPTVLEFASLFAEMSNSASFVRTCALGRSPTKAFHVFSLRFSSESKKFRIPPLNHYIVLRPFHLCLFVSIELENDWISSKWDSSLHGCCWQQLCSYRRKVKHLLRTRWHLDYNQGRWMDEEQQ